MGQLLQGDVGLLKASGTPIDHGFNLLGTRESAYGAGLSSSASIEMLMGEVLKEEFNLTIDQVDLVKLGQKTENDFVGLNSGIMDQFAVGMGKKDNAIFLDCNTLEYKYMPLELGDYEIVIMSTNKKHSLVGSAYNERWLNVKKPLSGCNKSSTSKPWGNWMPKPLTNTPTSSTMMFYCGGRGTRSLKMNERSRRPKPCKRATWRS